MKRRKLAGLLSLALTLSSCGGGGDGGGSDFTGPIGGTNPGSGGGTATCSLLSRQDWAAQQLREWYLFPETLPASLDPTPYTSVEDYIDALTATARAQHKDRYFTYLTSIAEEDACYNSGSSAGFGIRLGRTSSNRLFVTEAFE